MKFRNLLRYKLYYLLHPEKKELLNCSISPKAKLYEPYSFADVIVGEGSYISANGRISETTIGKYCSIGPDLSSGWGVHPLNGVSTSPMFYSTRMQNGRSLISSSSLVERKRIIIGNDVFIGRSVIILDGITIGDGAVIGAGAVVSKDIPPYAVAVGSPIRVVKYRFSPEVIEQLLEYKWWDKDDAILQKVADYCFDMPAFLQEINKT